MWKSNSHFSGYIQIHSLIESKYVFLYIIMNSICAKFSGGQSKLKMGSAEDSFVKWRMFERIYQFLTWFSQIGISLTQDTTRWINNGDEDEGGSTSFLAPLCGSWSAMDLTRFISVETPAYSAWSMALGTSTEHSNALVLSDLSLGLGIHYKWSMLD